MRATPEASPLAIEVEAWKERLQVMRRLFLSAEIQTPDGAQDAWLFALEGMRRTQADLVAEGRWRGGPRSLLGALRLEHQELTLTAGYAWLLRPDGHHGMGTKVLRALLDFLGLPPDLHLADAAVVVEETRGMDEERSTRADLVVYGRDFTIVIEAKTGAIEQDKQLDRLHRLWSDDKRPTFVFLTRGTRAPLTAVDSAGEWVALSWRQIARMVRAAAASGAAPAPGALEYATTLEVYHDV